MTKLAELIACACVAILALVSLLFVGCNFSDASCTLGMYALWWAQPAFALSAIALCLISCRK